MSIIKGTWKLKFLFFLLLTVILFSYTIFKGEPSAETYILSRIDVCYTQKQDPVCYKTLAEGLIKHYSLYSIFSALDRNQDQVKIFKSCHRLLHILGQMEYDKNKDLTKSLEEGNSICFSGYFHGVLEEYMDSKGIIFDDKSTIISWFLQNSKNICIKDTFFIAYNECLHGLGHGFMYATNSDLTLSLEICEALTGQVEKEKCYGGVFMENIMNIDNPDHPPQHIQKNDVMYPCSKLNPKYLRACYEQQSSYFAKTTNYNWPKTEDLCEKIPREYNLACYKGIGHALIINSQNLQEIGETCNNIKDSNKSNACFVGVTGALIGRYSDGYDKTLYFCSQLENKKEDCFDIVRNKKYLESYN